MTVILGCLFHFLLAMTQAAAHDPAGNLFHSNWMNIAPLLHVKPPVLPDNQSIAHTCCYIEGTSVYHEMPPSGFVFNPCRRRIDTFPSMNTS